MTDWVGVLAGPSVGSRKGSCVLVASQGRRTIMKPYHRGP